MAKQRKMKKSGLKPGDMVVMHTCYEARKEKNRGFVWKVDSEPWDLCGSEVVRLEGFSGGFATEFLRKVELRAVKIGPDRTDIVVGYGTNEELAAWYRDEADVSDEEWVDYKVSDYPMDVKVEWEEFGEMTLREFIADVTEFPCIAGWEE